MDEIDEMHLLFLQVHIQPLDEMVEMDEMVEF
jgi:hypothetical protein